MFDNIAADYDKLNHIMSLDIDRIWRRKALRQIVSPDTKQVLDLACGTGDFSIAIARRTLREDLSVHVTGVDLSEGMLAVMREKVAREGLQEMISMQTGDGENLPFGTGSFDRVTIAFGIRNFENREKGLREMLRVLRPGGKLVILELSVPENAVIRWCYNLYFLHILPVNWVFSNLGDTLDRGVLRYLINSLLIAGGATGIAMLCGIPAAYAMARMDFKGRKIYLGFVIMSQMFSPVVLLVGISRLMNTLHMNDTLAGLMFINAAFNQAFAIWLLRGTFVSISSEMEQAACIDGCSVLGAMLRILLPMAAPGIVTTLIFVFINAWNEYTVSTVLISTATNRPITVGITQFSSFNMIEWQYLFAAALLATVPVVILFMLIEKHLAAGLTAGGVKG